MAKAVAHCTCRDCGETFTKETKRHNRRDADSWKAWAEHNLDECPKCYGKRMRSVEAAKPPKLTVSINPHTLSKPIVMVWSGGTIEHKDTIKTIGFIWGDAPMIGTFGAFDASNRHCWSLNSDIDSYAGILDAAKTAIPDSVIDVRISELDLVMYNTTAKAEKERQEKINEEIAAIGPAPLKPDGYPTGRWNGTVYGKIGKYRIYIDGNETYITDELAESLSQYVKDRENHSKQVKSIKQQYTIRG